MLPCLCLHFLHIKRSHDLGVAMNLFNGVILLDHLCDFLRNPLKDWTFAGTFDSVNICYQLVMNGSIPC